MTAGAKTKRPFRALQAFWALVPPLSALLIQILLRDFFHPHVWFLFYPAVFLSSWIAGLSGALVGIAVSVSSALLFLIPAHPGFHALDAGDYAAAVMFAVTGVIFGAFNERLRRASAQTAEALYEAVRTNDRLRQAVKERRLLTALVENSSDLIGLADPEGKPIYLNPTGRRMVGLTDDHPVETTEVPRYFPADQRAQTDAIVNSLREGSSWRGETHLRNWTTGEPVPVSYCHFPIRDPDTGRLLGMGTVTRDISDVAERQRLEAALHASHTDLVRAQSVAHVGSWRLDVRHNVLQWSEEEYRIFGVKPGTPMTYDAFLACVHPEDRASVHREWTAALRGEPYDVEHRIVVNDEVRWVCEKADLEFDEQHALIGGMGVTLDITDRKRREEELRLAQERLELALRGADIALWDWNVETGEVVWNTRWAEMRGYRLDELTHHVDTWIAGVHPDDLPRVRQVLEEHFKGTRPEYEAEHRVRTKSGEFLWILDRGKVFERNAQGEPRRMAGTEIDITAWKRSEEALRLAEARSTGIVSIAADAIISLDRDQRITLFNHGAEKIFGYGKAEVIGAPLDVLVPERLRAAHRRHVESFAAGPDVSRRMGQGPGMTILGLRKSGEEFPADAAISKLEVAGEPILTVVLRDVTEQTRIEREQRFLAEIGEIFASSLDPSETLSRVAAAAVGIMADFVVLDAVEGTSVCRAKVAHADPAKSEVSRALEAFTPDRANAPSIHAAIETRQTQILTVTEDLLRSRSPEARALLAAMQPRSVMVVPLIASERVVGVMTFIASGRRYEARDVKLAEEVARRGALALENSRLYRVAHQAIQARDAILGVVAHDLRNPLNAIVMQASLLHRRSGEPERRALKPAEAIERAAKRMNRLIQDLLDVTRMEADRLTVERGNVHIEQALHDVLESQQPLASAGGIELASDLSPHLPDVSADPHRFHQVFENLIGNAMKFTEAGGRITLGAAPKEREILFWVADTGPGMAPEQLPHVFDRFWQAQKGPRRGAGLGLTIVKGIVEAHGGRIWVESTLGRGTTFYFTMPAAARSELMLAGTGTHGR